MHTKKNALESKEQEARKGLPTSPAAHTAENQTIPYSGWKEKGINGRFYGVTKRAVQGPAGSTGYIAVDLERNQVANGLFRRSPTKVAFFPDRQTALDTASQWFRQAQNIPVDEDIFKFHAMLWAGPPKAKMVSANEKLLEQEAIITVGEVPGDIVNQPAPETPTIPNDVGQAGASVKLQSRWRVLFGSVLAYFALFFSWMKIRPNASSPTPGR